MRNPYGEGGRIKVVGHRGWKERYPENTLAGFAAAVALGVDFLELDVHLTVDGHLVVIHDEDPYRTTGVHGLVREMTLDQVRRLDAGGWSARRYTGQRIPTLEEVMELADGRVGLAVEVKPPGATAERLDEKLIPLVRSFNGPAVVHSFDGEYIAEFKRKAPEVPVGHLCRLLTCKTIRETCEAGIDAIHPAWRTLTARLAREVRKTGLGIMIWAARSRRDCLHMVRKDCDAIGADCPDVLMEVLAERATGREDLGS